MEKRELIFDGNEKQVFSTDDCNKVIFRYKDTCLAYNGIKRAIFKGKGILDNKISALILGELEKNGIETHFIRTISDREQLCRKIEIIPLKITVRNRIAGSLADRLGVKDGMKAPKTIYDLTYNNDSLGDPLINDNHAIALNLVSEEELSSMYECAHKANEIVSELCLKAGIELVDMKIEFGRASDNGSIIISDEISPDTCRLWDISSGRKLDKDRFRQDLSDVVASYTEVLERLTKVINN